MVCKTLEVFIQMKSYRAYCKCCEKVTPMKICHFSKRLQVKLKCDICLTPFTGYFNRLKLKEFKE